MQSSLFNAPTSTRRRKPAEPATRKQVARIAAYSQEGTDRQQTICIALSRYMSAGGELSHGRAVAVLEACHSGREGQFVSMLLREHGDDRMKKGRES